MLKTIRVTEEAQEFFDRTKDVGGLRDLVGRSVREFGDAIGEFPLVIDASSEEGSDHVQIDIAAHADAAQGSELRARLRAFSRDWRSRNDHETRRAVGFSIHYL